MDNYSDDYLLKIINNMHIIEILSLILALISWVAFYDWFYFLGGFWAFLISLIPLTLWVICEEKIKDVINDTKRKKR